MELYTKKQEIDNKPLSIVYESVSDRWEVAAVMSESGFKQVSFVNSIATTKVHYDIHEFGLTILSRTLLSFCIISGAGRSSRGLHY